MRRSSISRVASARLIGAVRPPLLAWQVGGTYLNDEISFEAQLVGRLAERGRLRRLVVRGELLLLLRPALRCRRLLLASGADLQAAAGKCGCLCFGKRVFRVLSVSWALCGAVCVCVCVTRLSRVCGHSVCGHGNRSSLRPPAINHGAAADIRAARFARRRLRRRGAL